MYDNIIPLGDHCAVSMILNDIGVRKNAYPFDWCAHKDDGHQSNILLNIEYLIELLDNNNIHTITNKLLGNKISLNEKYNGDLVFPHETGNIENTNIKYQRRFSRLREHIINKSKNLYIIITRFNIIPEIQFQNLCRKIYYHNQNSKIIFISGVKQEFKNEFNNFEFKHIPYNQEDFCRFDYSHFRPQIKKYLQLHVDK